MNPSIFLGKYSYMKDKIVVVEDEKDIRDLISFNLLREDFEVHTAKDGEEALQVINSVRPDLILLDLMLPKRDGISVCQMIKTNSKLKSTGIIMLTAKGTEEDIVTGLESGADDYITKPFGPKILLARINAVLRRKKSESISMTDNTHKTNSSKISLLGIEIDPEKRKTYVDGNLVDLTFTEFQLLLLLVEGPGLVFTRSQIVDTIRGKNHAITDRSVDVQVVGLRKKLSDKGSLIETVRGVGYRFKEE